MKSIAIITRTKNRPVMLARALSSVKGQTYTDFVWMIVNDGGEKGYVAAIVDEAVGLGIDARVIHHEESHGMEAASNAGINGTDSRYIAIHDDDDTWDPQFLEKTISYLESTVPGGTPPGVVTRVVEVSEVIEGECIKIVGKKPYHPNLIFVTLPDVAELNRNPPPISFVYKREVLDDIGLPVLGDWDFLLRYLMKYDMGVIQEDLAYYHLRPIVTGGVYGNTIVAKRNTHLAWHGYIVDKHLKIDLERGVSGLGAFLYQAQKFGHMRENLYVVRVASNIVQMLKTHWQNLLYYLRSRFM